jgi:protein-L-isoaspartate(D-aspartate) O-methyltransferase
VAATTRAVVGRDEAVSSVSAPALVAEMLGQAADAVDGGVHGRHPVEIGSGGYNATLLSALVGPSVRSRW